MKKSLKFLGIIVLAAVIGFSMAACKTTGGTTEVSNPGLTITGLDKYNGMYIKAEVDDLVAGSRLVEDPNLRLLGNVAGAIIENGTVTLNVWVVEMDAEYDEYASDEEDWTDPRTFTPYTGSGEFEFIANIWGGEGAGEVYHYHFSVAVGNAAVKFNNGSAQSVINITYDDEAAAAEEEELE